ncbi:hypothetical protein DFH11DRAFT_882299 [Phellopilus nigrolimitatus]|nr:hypothetical protein DFH11DRAFT_882299 [Phellopilus nigrolimitatus]
MPAIRNFSPQTPGQSTRDDLSRPAGTVSPRKRVPAAGHSSATATLSPKKKKKPANAFILYRSHVIAHQLLPAGLHQNDVSCIIGKMWHAEAAPVRARFYRMADEEKLRCETEAALGIEREVAVKKRVRAPRSRKPKVTETKTTISPCPLPPSSPDVVSPVSPTLTYASPPPSSKDSASPTLTPSSDMSILLKNDEAPIAPQYTFTHLPEGSDFLNSFGPSSELSPSLFFSAPDPTTFPLDWEWSASDSTSSLSLQSTSAPAPIPETDFSFSLAELDNALGLQIDRFDFASLEIASAFSDFAGGPALATDAASSSSSSASLGSAATQTMGLDGACAWDLENMLSGIF